jgi:hypothetical protein
MNELNDSEQLIESVNKLASIVWAYYKALIEQGFSDGDAEKLTIAYQGQIINMIKPSATGL